MGCPPELNAAGARAIIEDAMRAVIARHRLEEIIGPVGTYGFLGLLSVVASPGEISIQYSGS